MKKNEKKGEDLSHVDEEYRNGIRKIIKNCGGTIDQAFETLLSHDFNAELAIQNLKSRDTIAQTFQYQQYGGDRVNSVMAWQQDLSGQQGNDDSDDEYEPYWKYRTSRSTRKFFYEKYPVNILWIKSIDFARKKSLKVSVSDHMHLAMRKAVRKKEFIPVNLVNSLEEGLCIGYHERFPVLALLSDLNKEMNSKLRELFEVSQNVKEMFEKQFIFVGLLAHKYNIEPWLGNLINEKDSLNHIIILRVNIFDDIQIMKKICLKREVKDILEEIKKAKAESIRSTIDQNYMKIKHRMNENGKYWKRPPGFKELSKKKEEKNKLLSNQKLRMEQEKNYRQLEEQRKIENQGIQKDLEKPQKESDNQINLEERRVLRQNLIIYQQGFRFKVRMPSGTSIFITVPEQETIGYIYDYIKSRQEEYGFQNEISRKFTLLVGLGQGENLDEKKCEPIYSVFSEPAFLVVKEID